MSVTIGLVMKYIPIKYLRGKQIQRANDFEDNLKKPLKKSNMCFDKP